jgi:hypothetical protein|nr:MAG TPA: hypothetical protein [Herelleviridae sp.]
MNRSEFFAKEFADWLESKGYEITNAQFPAVMYDDNSGKMIGAYITESIHINKEDKEILRTKLSDLTYNNMQIQNFLDKTRVENRTPKLMEEWSKEKGINLD